MKPWKLARRRVRYVFHGFSLLVIIEEGVVVTQAMWEKLRNNAYYSAHR